mmetsp:Transcript_19216/g.24935  ORF Transcript_19216/g.24935 Transcript_19216/m.24935 type:complete len:153 (-) Transcript_19216:190-648(-)
MLRLFYLVFVLLRTLNGFVLVPLKESNVRLNLFGGGQKKEGGGALSNVAGVMDQFKKAQQIAKRSNELQQELAATTVEGASVDGKIIFKVTGQQTPETVTIADFESYDGASLSASLTEALKTAQDKSLQVMNDKMQELYKEIGFGGPPPEND